MFWREREREINKEQHGGPPCGQVRVFVVGDSDVLLYRNWHCQSHGFREASVKVGGILVDLQCNLDEQEQSIALKLEKLITMLEREELLDHQWSQPPASTSSNPTSTSDWRHNNKHVSASISPH